MFILRCKVFHTRKTGRGVRTTRAFCKGEIVAEYPGDLLDSFKEYQSRESEYSKLDPPVGGYMYQFSWKGKTYW
jgi:hypothetical protein